MMRRLWVALLLAALAASLPSTTQAAPPISVSISGSGDLLAHNLLYIKAKTATGYNFRPMLAGVSELLIADVNICHLETPLTRDEPRSYPVFATPHQLANAIRAAGFDGCSVASNHSLDQGWKGVDTTAAELQSRGIQTAGTKPQESDRSVAWYTTAEGVKVAQLAYSYGFNGFSPPADHPHLVNRINTKQILRAAATVRSKGADLVIVSLHWGTEYADSPSSWQINIAKELTASPNIDGIIGHHTHVLQYAKLINGKPVVFGLGNLWSGQGPWKNQPGGQHGAVVTLNFEISGTGVTFKGGDYRPTLTLRGTWQVQPAEEVTRADSKAEACKAIKDAALHLSELLDGISTCPK